MKWINISDELLGLLEPYSDWFFQQDLSPLEELATKNPKNKPLQQTGWATSDEYLDEIVAKDGAHEGYPEISYSYDLQAGEHPKHFQDKYQKLSIDLLNFLGARNEAVHVFYPPSGFMSWHNNWNAHGYNILLSYSVNGGGWFKYRDTKSHNIIQMLDPGGWSCKVGYYGRGREPDKVYYHCAGTDEPRLTLGYVIPHLDLWQNMISDISGESADHFS